MVAADRPWPVPRNCSNAGAKSELDRPCRYSSGSTSATRGDLRDQAGRIAEENRLRSPVTSSIRLSLTRGARTGTAPAAVMICRGWWAPLRTTGPRPPPVIVLPRGVGPLRAPPPPAALVALPGMRLDVGRDLGLQRRGQHLPGAVADDLIEQRPARHDVVLVRLHGVVDYLEHGRTFPNQRANAGPDQNQMTSDHPREGAPTHVTPPEGHPQVLIIARRK